MFFMLMFQMFPGIKHIMASGSVPSSKGSTNLVPFFVSGVCRFLTTAPFLIPDFVEEETFSM